MVVKGAVGQEVHIVGVIDSIHIDKNGVKYDISLKSLENRFLRLGEKDILVIESDPEEMHFAEQITVTKEENAAAAEEAVLDIAVTNSCVSEAVIAATLEYTSVTLAASCISILKPRIATVIPSAASA